MISTITAGFQNFLNFKFFNKLISLLSEISLWALAKAWNLRTQSSSAGSKIDRI